MNHDTYTEPLTVLEEAVRFFQSNEDSWTQGVLARNQYGNVCHTFEEEATQLCAIGALSRFSKDSSTFDDAHKLLQAELPRRSIAGWNDHSQTTREEVIDVFTDALLNQKAQVETDRILSDPSLDDSDWVEECMAEQYGGPECHHLVELNDLRDPPGCAVHYNLVSEAICNKDSE